MRTNEMGQEVEEGYSCKPKDFDPNRPIMHYKSLLLICDGERCAKTGRVDKATHLRELLKVMGLNRGKNRIKVTRTGCWGACRFRQVAQIVENTQANGNPKNSSLWLRRVHQFDDTKWRRIFTTLSENGELRKELESEDFIPMRVYE
jgi:(2Fe-2S) ferredoxin